MAFPSNRSGSFSQTHPCAWRAFLLGSLCGILTIIWYLFALAERLTFKGLTRLSRFADSFSNDPTKGAGQFNVLFDEAESSFALQHDCTYAPCYEFEPVRIDRSQSAHRRPGSQFHISWILMLASLTGLSLHPCQSQTADGTTATSIAASISDATVAVAERNIGLLGNPSAEPNAFGIERYELS
ncbi:MAG: hypothetical protein WBA18_03200 [Terracidiphilus sp.]